MTHRVVETYTVAAGLAKPLAAPVPLARACPRA